MLKEMYKTVLSTIMAGYLMITTAYSKTDNIGYDNQIHTKLSYQEIYFEGKMPKIKLEDVIITDFKPLFYYGDATPEFLNTFINFTVSLYKWIIYGKELGYPNIGELSKDMGIEGDIEVLTELSKFFNYLVFKYLKEGKVDKVVHELNELLFQEYRDYYKVISEMMATSEEFYKEIKDVVLATITKNPDDIKEDIKIQEEIAAQLMALIFIEHYKKVNPQEGKVLEVMWYMYTNIKDDPYYTSAFKGLVKYLIEVKKPINLTQLYYDVITGKNKEVLFYVREPFENYFDIDIFNDIFNEKATNLKESIIALKYYKNSNDISSIKNRYTLYTEELLFHAKWFKNVTGISIKQLYNAMKVVINKSR